MSEPWITTFTGRQFFPLNPRIEDIDITDIAHHLSNLCRYTGAPKGFYSVAQHSVLVSQVCHPKDALWGLLHDAAEAYTGDLNRPVKHAPGFEAFRRIEHLIQLKVCEAFGLSDWEPESVKWADAALLATERRDLLRPPQFKVSDREWLHGAQNTAPLSTCILPWPMLDAESAFLDRYKELSLVMYA